MTAHVYGFPAGKWSLHVTAENAIAKIKPNGKACLGTTF